MELAKYYLTEITRRFNYCLLVPTILAVALLNSIFRLDWVLSPLQNLMRKNRLLVRIYPLIKNPVSYWKDYIKNLTDNYEFFEIEYLLKTTTKHCANKPATYIGFKYVRALQYTINRIEKN